MLFEKNMGKSSPLEKRKGRIFSEKEKEKSRTKSNEVKFFF